MYWFLVDFIYAKEFELYHPFRLLIELSFLLFVLVSFNYNYKVFAALETKARLAVSGLIPAALALVFLLVLYYYGLDFHIWVGLLLYPDSFDKLFGWIIS